MGPDEGMVKKNNKRRFIGASCEIILKYSGQGKQSYWNHT